jgi:predicted AAA+ superfamily ATPase
MIHREFLFKELRLALKQSRVVALLGPRQCGKTTLARLLVDPVSMNYFDLEDPESLARLEQPMLALRPLKGLVVIDEIQRRPDLFPVLRVLCDRVPLPARFLILGSASTTLLRQSSESLAGRITFLPTSGFSLSEIGAQKLQKHWLRGGYPLSFLAKTDSASFEWRKHFLQTFLERDLPQLTGSIPTTALVRFLNMLTHYHGQLWNAADPARSLGVSEPTVRRYLDLLTDTHLIYQLQPWHANIGKRQIKSPKIYFRDSGLLHQLLGIRTDKDLWTHPKSGASWEGYALNEILKATKPDRAFFWGTHNGAEIDLVLFKKGSMYGVECKRMDAPKLTPSIPIAMKDLGLKRISVVYPGSTRYRLQKNVEVVPLSMVIEGMGGLFP